MVRQTTAKILTLLVAVTILAIEPADIDLASFAMMRHATAQARLTYSFLHVNFLHALCNAWCLLSLAFIYRASIWQLLVAYGIAVTVPECLLTTTPTVGASAMCFALMGMLFYNVIRKAMYFSWVAATIAVGAFFPSANALLHLYCFAAGLAIGFLDYPCLRR